MNLRSWFPSLKPKPVVTVAPEVIKYDYMKSSKPENEYKQLLSHVEKLSTHNSTHGKNVVFWSCNKCNPGQEIKHELDIRKR